MRRLSILALTAGTAVAFIGSLVSAPPAALAEETSEEQAKPPAVISLGDSYISGEAGRWQGNANGNLLGSRYGTDLAAYKCNSSESWCYHDARRVYGASYNNGCNRSKGAEIHHLEEVRVNGRTFRIAEENRINIACSGAETEDILHRKFKQEPPQIEQLADYAAEKDIKLVVVSIGGNDLGFGEILKNCAKEYLEVNGTHCHTDWGPRMPQKIAAMKRDVGEVLSAVRRTMSDAGYALEDYRLVMQSYPSPLPKGADNRYREGYVRFTAGCPFFNDDSDWAHDVVVPDIAEAQMEAARELTHPADFLDLQHSLDGHEVCAAGVRQSTQVNTLSNPLPKDSSEWVRFAGMGLSQGQAQESLHPNFYGQQELGRCLSSIARADTSEYTCNAPA